MIGHFSGFHNAVGHFPLNPASKVTTRYFTSIDSTLGQYYVLGSPIVFPSDFSATVKFALVDGQYSFPTLLSSRDSSVGLRLSVDVENNRLLLRVYDGTGFRFLHTTLTFNTPSDRKMHSVVLSRTGNIYSITVDNSIAATARINAVTLDIAYAGVKSEGDTLSQFFNGVLADLAFLGADVASTKFSISNATAKDGSFEKNNGNTLIAVNTVVNQPDKHVHTSLTNDVWRAVIDLWSASAVNVGSQWTDNDDGTYTLSSDGTFSSLSNANVTQIGAGVVLDFDVIDFTGVGSLKYQNSSTVVSVNAAGNVTVEYVTDGTAALFARNSPTEIINTTIKINSLNAIIEIAYD
ncbi:MAG: hypothetical protein JKX67_00545 [Colwellia sp.]|nr:hypothetical protein [Colwellia sp.]